MLYYSGKEKQRRIADAMQQFSSLGESYFAEAAAAKSLRKDLSLLFPPLASVVETN
jgi:hypothetical protein